MTGSKYELNDVRAITFRAASGEIVTEKVIVRIRPAGGLSAWRTETGATVTDLDVIGFRLSFWQTL